MLRLCSHGQSYRVVAEVYGNYETIQLACQIASDKSSDAGDEHGNDEGVGYFSIAFPCLTRTAGRDHGGNA
jgi:hypothetical protein